MRSALTDADRQSRSLRRELDRRSDEGLIVLAARARADAATATVYRGETEALGRLADQCDEILAARGG